MTEDQSTVSVEGIEKKILFLRGQKVMLDVHLAHLYGGPSTEQSKETSKGSLQILCFS